MLQSHCQPEPGGQADAAPRSFATGGCRRASACSASAAGLWIWTDSNRAREAAAADFRPESAPMVDRLAGLLRLLADRYPEAADAQREPQRANRTCHAGAG